MGDALDPYQPPASPHPEASTDPSVAYLAHRAGPGRRFVNFFVDYIGSIVMSVVLVGIVETASPGFVDSMSDMAANLIILFGMSAYYILFEGLFGRTPGKWITGTKVISNDGGVLTIKQVVARTASRFVPFEPFSLFSAQGLWHDRWASATVVRVRGV